MKKLSRDDLFSLEKYAQIRAEFRSKVIAHKKKRHMAVGPNMTLQFEDRLTIQYQIQEMLRIEKIFETEGITDELQSYNPLIPDGDNWKVSLMIEFDDEIERRKALTDMVGVENKVWVRVGQFDPVYAIADEDLDRTTQEKTSAVHFLRFQLPEAQISAIKGGESFRMGVEHDAYTYQVDVPPETQKALAEDLN